MKKLNELLKCIQIDSDDANVIELITFRIEDVIDKTLFIGIERKGYSLTEDIMLAKKKGAIVVSREDGDYTCTDCVWAYGVLLHAFNDFDSLDLCVIGVTGTNGKTTVSSYLYQMLKKLGKKVLLIGTNGIVYENIKEDTVNTTPSQEVLARWFLFAKENCVEYVVMEVSSIGIHQKRLAGIQFDYMIMTNVTVDHLDYHNSLLEYQLCKYQSFQYLKTTGVAIINTDSALLRMWASQLGVRVIEYNMHMIEILELRMKESLFIFNEFLIQSNQVSICNIYNLCACICLLKDLHFSHQEITKVCKSLLLIEGRFQLVHEFPFVVVDFAHTEDALFQILSFYRSIKEGNLVIVFGCGGNRDVLKRPKMGKVACELADIVIVTEDNSRQESVENIVKDIISGCNGKQKVIYSRKDAIKYALSIVDNSDIIIIAGKGNEQYLLKDNVCVPMSDVEIINEFYKGR